MLYLVTRAGLGRLPVVAVVGDNQIVGVEERVVVGQFPAQRRQDADDVGLVGRVTVVVDGRADAVAGVVVGVEQRRAAG
jgi:hypothetical protein